MEYFYSASTGGFYRKDIHGKKIPADAVAITDKRHAELMAAQSEGKQITADEKGRPVARDYNHSKE